MKMSRSDSLRTSAMLRIIIVSIAVLKLLFLETECLKIPETKSNQSIMRLSRFNVPKYESVDAFDDMLQTINAYMFEYKKGSRIAGICLFYIINLTMRGALICRVNLNHIESLMYKNIYFKVKWHHKNYVCWHVFNTA